MSASSTPPGSSGGSQSGPVWVPRGQGRLLGREQRRLDGPAKISGRARYAHDQRPPGMVYARLLLSPLPAAEVRALDLAPALAIEGVVGAQRLVEERVRFLGEPLAVVAAETPELAEDGIRAIRADLEETDWVVTEEAAKAEGAPQLSRRGNVVRRSETGDRAAAEAALEGCAAVVEATYRLPVQHHVCLETHGVVVDYRGGDTATVYASTQNASGMTPEAARALDMGAEAVHVEVEHMGGGFGSKFSLGVEGQAACRLARELERPVHLFVTRPDEFLMAGNRSGSRFAVRGGMDAEGTLVALVTDHEKHGGLGPGPGTTLPYIYRVSGAHYTESYGVYTNLDAFRAMRAPGHPQASFAMESVVDELAYELGLDPLEVRKRNLPDPVWHRQLDRVAREIGWADHPHKTAPGSPNESFECVGIGFGVSVWGGAGRPDTRVAVRIEKDGSVTASVGTQDLGTGTRTYVAAIVAEELGLPLEAVTPRIGDSRYPFGHASGGSVTTPTLAPAVKDAAHKARVALAAHLAEVQGGEPDRVVLENGRARLRGGEELDWAAACRTLMSPIEVVGEWVPELAASGIHGAQAARVRVDALTGAVTVEKMVAIHDVGRPLNPLALRSQINGGMVQALSYALLEQRVLDPDLGTMLNANLEDYKIAGCVEIGELVAIVDPDDDRDGVVGMAEAPIIPGHSAIANAVYNACGVRVRELPLTPDKILMGLEARKG